MARAAKPKTVAAGDKPAKKSAYCSCSLSRAVVYAPLPPSSLFIAAKSGGAAKGKLTPYNKFMKEELARLKEESPDMKHPERLVFLAY